MRRGARPIVVLLVAAGLTALVYGGAVLTVPGQWLDDEVFGWAQDLPPRPMREVLPTLARSVLPPVVLMLLGVAVLVGCVRRRWMPACSVRRGRTRRRASCSEPAGL